jgi:hypothetical protein
MQSSLKKDEDNSNIAIIGMMGLMGLMQDFMSLTQVQGDDRDPKVKPETQRALQSYP